MDGTTTESDSEIYEEGRGLDRRATIKVINDARFDVNRQVDGSYGPSHGWEMILGAV